MPSEVGSGAIARLLRESYADILDAEPNPWESEARRWDEFDAEVFAHPDTVGACAFLSWFGEHLVGFASYDPRGRPAVGILGHNCILPALRHRGFGREQLREALRRLAGLGIRAARVTTCDHPFFAPARRMYEAVGFREVRRSWDDVDARRRRVDFELVLDPRGEGL